MGLPYARRERPAACHRPIQYIECRKQIRYCLCPNPRGEFQGNHGGQVCRLVLLHTL